MFLESYKPRHSRIKKKKLLGLIKYVIFISVLLIIVLIYVISEPKDNKNNLDKEFFIGNYEKSKNILKIENATFVGKDKKKRPYTITAKLAIKESSKKNTFMLESLKADISLKEKNWLILKTKMAFFDINLKVLSSNQNVEAFYDDGTSFISPSLSYNLNNGIIYGNEGIEMLGKWGNIKSDYFSYSTDDEVLVFDKNPVMLINQ